MFIHKNSTDVEKFIQRFGVFSFSDDQSWKDYFSFFHLWDLCDEFRLSDQPPIEFDETFSPLAPDLKDLARLHYVALKRKSFCILELGSGYSTLIFAHAMQTLQSLYGEQIVDLTRIDKPFHVYSVDEQERYKDAARERIPKALREHVTMSHSDVDMVIVDGQPSTIYKVLPDVLPDLIYVDGPSTHACTKNINGISLCRPERMPMSSDLIKLEFFLEPGCCILFDGRTANARFLYSRLKRSWNMEQNIENDICILELNEQPLGALNQNKMKFCLNGDWFLS